MFENYVNKKLQEYTTKETNHLISIIIKILIISVNYNTKIGFSINVF